MDATGHQYNIIYSSAQSPKGEEGVVHEASGRGMTKQNRSKPWLVDSRGGDKLDYPGPTATDTTSLITFKVHINSVVSIPDARYLTADISNFYY